MSDHTLQTPVLLYDGDYSFCRSWVHYWKQCTGDAVSYRPYQEAAGEYEQVSKAAAQDAVQFIDTDGSTKSGAEAAFAVLAIGGSTKWQWLYDTLPGVALLSEYIYRLVAANRSFFASVTEFLFGTPLKPSKFVFSTWVFTKVLGMVYLIAFLSFWVQAHGLIGSSGILPVGEFIEQMQTSLGADWLIQHPTLFGIVTADWMITLVAILGVLFATALIAGVLPRFSLIALFVLYLSIVNGGQIFFSYQWDTLLLEVGFLAMFISPQSNIVVYLLWWLLARLMISSGLAKLYSGDQSWWDLTALTYHYQTQPLPTVFGYLFDTLPKWFHQVSALVMFVIEFGAAALLFLGRRLRMAGGAAIVLLQALIGLTGNYTFFNLLTAALVILTLDDAFWSAALGASAQQIIDTVGKYGLGWPMHMLSFPFSARTAFWAGTVVLVVYGTLSLSQFWTTLQQRDTPLGVRATAAIGSQLHIANAYGLFASMTKERPEIMLEGSRDGEKWRAYDFKYKPDDLVEPPAWVQPHQPRLDWQMWFAALRGDPRQSRWFLSFVRRLLEGSEPVERLLANNPFENRPPQYIRARIFNYDFADVETLLADGRWWQRSNARIYLPPVSLQRQ